MCEGEVESYERVFEANNAGFAAAEKVETANVYLHCPSLVSCKAQLLYPLHQPWNLLIILFVVL